MKHLQRIGELFAFFIGVPSLMVLGYLPRSPIPVLLLLSLLAYLFLRSKIVWRADWNELRLPLFIFLLGLPFAAALAFFLVPERFLSLPLERPQLWILISILYPLLSVTAQEILYRVWFWERYALLFPSEVQRILASAFVFAYGHIVLRNWAALILCLFGGLLFGLTYSRSRTFFPVWLEHSLWGVLLFTLGFGKYLYHGAHTG